jgi:hypothetical protein
MALAESPGMCGRLAANRRGAHGHGTQAHTDHGRSMAAVPRNSTKTKVMAKESEREIEMLARIIALEYLVKQLLWNLMKDDDDPVKQTELFAESATKEIANSAFPGIEPALSDHVSDLVREHVARVLRELADELEA